MAFDFFLNFATKNLFKLNLSMSERQRDIAHTRYDDGQWTNQSIEEHCLGVAALASLWLCCRISCGRVGKIVWLVARHW